MIAPSKRCVDMKSNKAKRRENLDIAKVLFVYLMGNTQSPGTQQTLRERRQKRNDVGATYRTYKQSRSNSAEPQIQNQNKNNEGSRSRRSKYVDEQSPSR